MNLRRNFLLANPFSIKPTAVPPSIKYVFNIGFATANGYKHHYNLMIYVLFCVRHMLLEEGEGLQFYVYVSVKIF